MLLLALSVPGAALAGRLFDHQTRVRSSTTGETFFVAQRNLSGALAAVLILAALALALHSMLSAEAGGTGGAFAAFMLALVAWWLVSMPLRHGEKLRDYLSATAALLLVAGVRRSPPTRETVRTLALILAWVCASVWAFALLDPNSAKLACRHDKCGAFGYLLVGYFPQENNLALILALLLGTTVALRRHLTALSFQSLGLVTLLATGSRTGVLAGLAAVLATWWVRLQTHRSSAVVVLARALPLAGLAASAYVFITATGSNFTGRGLIYSQVKQNLAGRALLAGSGPGALHPISVPSAGTTYLPDYEHGFVPHLLAQTGLVGLALASCAFLALAISRPTSEQLVALPVVAGVAFASVTEAAWKLDLRWPTFWSILLCVGLLSRRESAREPDAPLRELVAADA